MASSGNPEASLPYLTTNDCSQGFCSFSCPQWCYIIFPQPPPPPLVFPQDDGDSPNFSPYLIAIIGVLTAAFLLVSYYAIVSNYCGNSAPFSLRRTRQNQDFHLHSWDPSLQDGWHAAVAGLDEEVIGMITVCEYRRGDGLVEGTECSVCLNEFRDGDRVRLLPKCPHAFHVDCIDTWLKSHASCPLCRAGIFFGIPSPPLQQPSDPPQTVEENRGVAQERQAQRRQSTTDIVIEIPEGGLRGVRRSVSMDNFTVANVLRMEDGEREEEFSGDGESSSNRAAEAAAKLCSDKRASRCVKRGVAIRRSLSSGRFFLARQGRAREIVDGL